ncbi:SUMF1/EgtB/PvdO family nonheme iron enzyme [Tatumella sp. UCD-D_suzukii]|uniref:formylglycine-generating enzyme family protein n=1 Tax=Tatumella sp. UCD-D_suzukii TaxID=1408192 RepID=UPI00046E68D3|nr:SUMF1/EgtB/PvdO family nonheme iron enzyme [Tatumella sp. UCD-D_suzukii]
MNKETVVQITLMALALAILAGCRDEQEKKADQDALVSVSLNNLVMVKGGEFLMGDFGPLIGEKLPFNVDKDTPLHRVILSDFRIGKYRVTWGEFNRWLDLQGREENDYYRWTMDHKDPDFQSDKVYMGNNYPATVSWQDARSYCQWLGQVSNRHMDLPTESQWEYAARSRGQFLIFSNADNKNYLYEDKNINYALHKKKVGSYPPNPLGLYDMMGNGSDWVKDWYAADYYKYSPEKDPQGPDTGDKKVHRPGNHDARSYTISRNSKKPDNKWGSQFRCVENSPLK